MSTSTLATAQRILVGSTAVARAAFRDQDGEPTGELTGSTVTATVRDFDGVASGSTGRATTWDTALGVYTVALTSAETASLAVWKVDWLVDGTLRQTTAHRIVGGFMLSRTELQARPELGAYSDAQIDLAREWISNLIEHQTGAAWHPRWDRHTWVVGNVETSFRLDSRYKVADRAVMPYRPVRTLEALTIDGQAVAVSDVDIDQRAGTLHYRYGFQGVCTADFTHGTDNAPETLRRAAEIAVVDVLTRNTSGLTQRTRSVTNEVGAVQTFSFPGLDHPTGLDFVDAAIRDYDQRLVEGIA